MRKFEFTINGNDYEVELKNFEDNIAEIEVNGTVYNVEVHKKVQHPKTPRLVRQEVSTPRSHSKIKKELRTKSTPIKAPLPGNIVQVFVKEGEQVKKGDKLLTYEAMKMENELKSEKDGEVKSIKVSPGDSVLQDDVLMEIA
ncbi:MAG: biotin/lipoyl-binding protein [Bacteroidales bacterium]|nr:biotin/lipoyl-binding protein [Bacteroidales bacterium]